MAKAAIAPEPSPTDNIFPEEEEIFSPDGAEEEVGDDLYEEQNNFVQEEILPTAGMGKLNLQSSYNPFAVL